MKEKLKSTLSETGAKPFLIIILLLLFLIPLGFISSLIHDRERYQNEAVDSILEPLGGNPEIQGLVMALPYIDYVEEQVQGSSATTSEPKTIVRQIKRYIITTPEEYRVEGEIFPYYLNRGIFKIPVFTGNLNLNATFKPVDYKSLDISPDNILWDQGLLLLGVSRRKILTELPVFNIGNTSLETSPVIQENSSPFDDFTERTGERTLFFELPGGVVKSEFEVSGTLKIQGGEVLRLQPLGTDNKFNISSEWQTPSFSGGWLPNERIINEEGFSAKWNIPGLSTVFPQSWICNGGKQGENISIELFTPVNTYQKTYRSIKYAFLFLLVPFLSIFICELFTRIKIHPVQYCLMGIADILFYLLLLSISEHLAFGTSYLISALCVVGATLFYGTAIFKNIKWGGMLAVVQVISYVFLFGTLQAEDFALLIGSIGLFAVVVILMVITKKVDWYSKE